MERKSIILYGASDRYNFGDNLMPIVHNAFLQKYHPNVFEDYKVECAALFRSDLSKYKCLPTVPIRKFFKNIEEGSVLIVVGGETLNSKALNLYFFCIQSKILKKVIGRLKKKSPRVKSAIGSLLCRTGFEYPFTPPLKAFRNNVKICYNAVGGKIPSEGGERLLLLDRLKAACYISVRDSRSNSDMSELGCKVHVSPDSVSSISDLFDDDHILDQVSERVQIMTRKKYFVFQSSPHKTNFSPTQTAEILMKSEDTTKTPFILLPIGYAAGHDDREYLNAVARNSDIPVLDNLNVWEILWVIRNSNAYFGTSLHGAIIAMAYQIPHFAIGSVPKLAAYLDEWSSEPFTGLRSVSEIPQLISMLEQDHQKTLAEVARKTRVGALRNMHNLFTAAEVLP